MSQNYASAGSLPPLQPLAADTPTIIPTQVHYDEKRIRTSMVDIVQVERQDEVELIWEREQQRLKEREAIQDKFATLFEPPTPRASPTLSPSSLPTAAATGSELPLFDHPRQTTLGRHSSRMVPPSSNISSEFGSFVEATQDPLSFALAHERRSEGRSTGGDATPCAANTTTPKFAEAYSNSRSKSHSNTTLNFFDTFTYDAKQRFSAARSQVLDELLLHEDDPMWFVLQVRDDMKGANQADPPSKDATSIIPTTDSSDEPSKDLDESAKQISFKSVLLDIDHDYFRPSPVPSSHASPRSLSPIRHRMPSRSSSIPSPVVAPPVACQLTASPPASHYLEFDPLFTGSHVKPPISSVKEQPDSSHQSQALVPERSPSLGSLSSKLMTSLLRGPQSSPPPSSLKLADTQSSSNPSLDHAEEQASSTSTVDAHQAASSDEDPRPPRPLTVSSTFSMSPPLEGRVSHFSVSKQRFPFAPAIVTHSSSPFAPTFYSPPSGAPGFKADRYDWDKGFSDELESERKGNPFTIADVHDSNGSDGNGAGSGSVANSNVGSPISRGSWGTGFGFGFGTVRASKSMSHTPSPPSSVLVQGNELNGDGREGRNLRIIPDAQKMGSNWQDHDAGHNRHERMFSSTSTTDTGSAGGMGDLIERKVGTIELVGRRASSDSVLTPELASMLRAHLPALSRLPRSWKLIYSLDQHGISLNTLYSHCEAHLSQKLAPGDLGVSKGMLLAIKDGGSEQEHKAIFGAWIAEGLKLNKGKGYSGGGESFLWKYDGILKIFRATGKNNYVSLCEADCISFGGGDGHYGLYLDDTLFEGSSASCPTFDNEPLCAGRILGNLRTVKFECLGLEVWGMA